MQEIAFSIPVSGTIKFEENSVTIIVNRAETSIKFEPAAKEDERISLPKGMTVFDVLLYTAQRFVKSTGQNRFSAAELYHEAIRKYPGLKHNTWTSHVIASAPGHNSYKYHVSKRDYFKYIGHGVYSLALKYVRDSDNENQEDRDGE